MTDEERIQWEHDRYGKNGDMWFSHRYKDENCTSHKGPTLIGFAITTAVVMFIIVIGVMIWL